MVFGFTYTFAYKPSDDKLHCKICNSTHFIPSKKMSKFIGEDEQRVISTGIFHQCANCSALTDVKVN